MTTTDETTDPTPPTAAQKRALAMSRAVIREGRTDAEAQAEFDRIWRANPTRPVAAIIERWPELEGYWRVRNLADSFGLPTAEQMKLARRAARVGHQAPLPPTRRTVAQMLADHERRIADLEKRRDNGATPGGK